MGCKGYPNTGFSWSNEGTIIFKGKCFIGNNSSIIVGKTGTLTFGQNFLATTSLKLFCFCNISFLERTIFGWDCTVQDTDFHPLYNIKKKCFNKGYGKIVVGKNNWFSQGCLILHSVRTPDNCIFAARSVITRKSESNEYCIHSGYPSKVIAKNMKLDYDNYMIQNYSDP